MERNVNSFADNMAELTKSCAEMISVAQGFNESLYGNDTEVVVSDNITLPSYSNIVNRIERAENTIAKFTQGNGVIETNDGTYRKIKVTAVSAPPERIVGIQNIDKFSINPNWFFENLQYPKCVVNIPLKGLIDDSSDRVYVSRVILDAKSLYAGGYSSVLDFYRDKIEGKGLYYTTLIDMLEEYGIRYMEDKDEVSLPLTYEKFHGQFKIMGSSLVKDANGVSRLWHYLDGVEYDYVNSDGIVQSGGNILKPGDLLRGEDCLYKISDINTESKCVRLDSYIGYGNLSTGAVFEIYSDPFSEKTIDVGIGIDEIDIIYIRGVNEDFNLLSREWSDPVEFYTNELRFSDDMSTTFLAYYTANVSDFGRTWISQAKERMISAYEGKQPYAPTLVADDLRVVQINRQLDAVMDNDSYNTLTSEIATVKSNISAVRNTISSNKDMLVQTNDTTERANIQNTIATDTETLSSLATQYSSLVNELSSLLVKNGAIGYTPKYHVRGFFTIPDSRYSDETNGNRIGEEKIVSFEIWYRYIHTDNTGMSLDTYTYTNSDNVSESGTFTDWNVMQSSTLSKVYDPETDTYVWNSESSADGSTININQIDIPIRSGEKVEIKARSVSEAGYPYNPLKSEWSNSIIIAFPDNLTSNDAASSILDSVKSDMTAVRLQQTMKSAGVYSHMDDTNSTYKHSADHISYVNVDSGTNTEMETSLQGKISEIDSQLQTLQNFSALTEDIRVLVNDLSERLTSLENTLNELSIELGYADAETNRSTISQRTFTLSEELNKMSELVFTTKTNNAETASKFEFIKTEMKSMLNSINTNTQQTTDIVNLIKRMCNCFINAFETE